MSEKVKIETVIGYRIMNPLMLKPRLFIFKFLIKMVNQICAFLFVGIHTLEIEGIEKWNDL